MERFNSFSSDQIIITKRQASMMMASMLLFCLFAFIVGFFLGKRAVIDDFSSQVTKEALHDQIDFLLTTQSLQTSSQEDSDVHFDGKNTVLENKEQNDFPALEEIVIPSVIVQEKVLIDQQNQKKADDLEQTKTQVSAECTLDTTKQYAQLIGFGTKKAAQAFVARLQKHDVSVVLKTIISKTASGKQRTWYQAITPIYESCELLQAQLAKIKRLEHIRDKDIKIVHIK